MGISGKEELFTGTQRDRYGRQIILPEVGVEGQALLLKIGNPMIGRLLLYSALEGDFTTVMVNRDATCPLCAKDPSITAVVSDRVNPRGSVWQ